MSPPARQRPAALYETTIRHTRAGPVVNAFTYRSYHWLVDLDALPAERWPWRALARFDPRDHGDGRAPSLRADIDRYLEVNGVDLDGGTITMLGHARVLGHVFNPLTMFWCHRPDETLRCVVAEVHNTYGGRHRYLLHPDDDGRATVPKSFYVSPFNPVDGLYQMSVPEPDERLAIAIHLQRPGDDGFIATLRGRRLAAGRSTLIRLALRYPLAPLVGSVRIRRQGLKLARAGLPIVGRPDPGSPGSGNVRPHRPCRRRSTS